jgi:hypothetical protein
MQRYRLDHPSQPPIEHTWHCVRGFFTGRTAVLVEVEGDSLISGSVDGLMTGSIYLCGLSVAGDRVICWPYTLGLLSGFPLAGRVIVNLDSSCPIWRTCRDTSAFNCTIFLYFSLSLKMLK